MMRRVLPIALALLLSTGPAPAQELRPAPDYLVEAIVAITIAEHVAGACPELRFDSDRASETTVEVLGQLSAEGVDIDDPASTIRDYDEAVRAAQDAFRAKHGLGTDWGGVEAACAAGRAEIAAASPVGGFLVDIAGGIAAHPTLEPPEK